MGSGSERGGGKPQFNRIVTRGKDQSIFSGSLRPRTALAPHTPVFSGFSSPQQELGPGQIPLPAAGPTATGYPGPSECQAWVLLGVKTQVIAVPLPRSSALSRRTCCGRGEESPSPLSVLGTLGAKALPKHVGTGISVISSVCAAHSAKTRQK